MGAKEMLLSILFALAVLVFLTLSLKRNPQGNSFLHSLMHSQQKNQASTPTKSDATPSNAPSE